MNDKTIAELREWKKAYDVFPSMANDNLFLEILSRAESETKEEGLCGHCNGSGMVSMGPNIRGIKTCPTCNGKGKIIGTRSTPAKEEPLGWSGKSVAKSCNCIGPDKCCDKSCGLVKAYLNGLPDVKGEGKI